MEALFSQSEQDAASVETQTEAGRTKHALRYRDHAIWLNMEGRFAEAETYSREALHLGPDDVDTLNELGVAVWRQGRPAEAEAIYLRASQLEPNDFRILTNLGLALFSLGRIDEAGASFRKALEIRPNTFDAVMNLGIVLTDQGGFDEGLACLYRAHELRPDSADALQNIGMNLACQGRLDEAIAYFDRARSSSNPNPPKCTAIWPMPCSVPATTTAVGASTNGGSGVLARKVIGLTASPGMVMTFVARPCCYMRKTALATSFNSFATRARSKSAAAR